MIDKQAPCGCPIIKEPDGHRKIFHVIGCNNPDLELINNEIVVVVKDKRYDRRTL